MRLFIPKLGSQLKLTQDWSFYLHTERRNLSLFPLVKNDEDWVVAENVVCQVYNCKKSNIIFNKISLANWLQVPAFPFTCKTCKNEAFAMAKAKIEIPAGAVLTVDRIYIRKTGAAGEFDSVSFYLDIDTSRQLLQNPKLTGRPRFWAKLDDVNDIHFDFVNEQAEESK
jgi:hypothetical protein